MEATFTSAQGFKKHRNVNGGNQYLFRFENGFGASVVRHDFSYGGSRGLYELAVIQWGENDDFELKYDTGLTDDVEGYLSVSEVLNFLNKIENLIHA